MIFLSLLVILLNWRLSRRVLTRKKHSTVRKLRKTLIKGRAAVKTGMLTPIDTVILALEAGMTLEDVRSEYVSATGTREQILESVFGKLADNKFFARLISSSRFMETGYANEKVFLDLWKSESYRELVLTVNATCRVPNADLSTGSPADHPADGSGDKAIGGYFKGYIECTGY
uniref:PrmC_N domain-containing protein n=1 Tax=Caenorhabditis tropicalis TaxID=1561998 RepID=A0A1I7TXG6_9PELO